MSPSNTTRGALERRDGETVYRGGGPQRNGKPGRRAADSAVVSPPQSRLMSLATMITPVAAIGLLFTFIISDRDRGLDKIDHVAEKVVEMQTNQAAWTQAANKRLVEIERLLTTYVESSCRRDTCAALDRRVDRLEDRAVGQTPMERR